MTSITFVPSERLIDLCKQFGDHPNQNTLAINIAATLASELALARHLENKPPDPTIQRYLPEDSPDRRWNLNFPRLQSACGNCGDMIDPEARVKVWLSWGAPAHCQKPECTPKGILKDAR